MSESSIDLIQLASVTVARFKDNSILDSMAIQRIGNELFELIDQHKRPFIVLDFREVRFLSSQALGVLLTLRRKADAIKSKVALASLRPELARVFKITNLDRMFAFYSDSQTAAKALDPNSPIPEELEG